jgi:hypothetical protein
MKTLMLQAWTLAQDDDGVSAWTFKLTSSVCGNRTAPSLQVI